MGNAQLLSASLENLIAEPKQKLSAEQSRKKNAEMLLLPNVKWCPDDDAQD